MSRLGQWLRYSDLKYKYIHIISKKNMRLRIDACVGSSQPLSFQYKPGRYFHFLALRRSTYTVSVCHNQLCNEDNHYLLCNGDSEMNLSLP